MITQDRMVESDGVGRWSEAWEDPHRRIVHRFSRSEVRKWVCRYVADAAAARS
jgi:hypothetical protein